MRGIQLSIAFPAGEAPGRIKDIQPRAKKAKSLGRPRRIKSEFILPTDVWEKVSEALGMYTKDGPVTVEQAFKPYLVKPCIIKISLTSQMVTDIESVRCRMEGSATFPDLVRLAVDKFIAKYGDLCTGINQNLIERQMSKRCSYHKILFPPETVSGIELISKRFGTTRQAVILSAIKEYVNI